MKTDKLSAAIDGALDARAAEPADLIPRHVLTAFEMLQRGFQHGALTVVAMTRDGRVVFTIGLAGVGDHGSFTYEPLAVVPSEATLAALRPATVDDMLAAGLVPAGH